MIVCEEGIGSFKFVTRYPNPRRFGTYLVAGSYTEFGFWIRIRVPVLYWTPVSTVLDTMTQKSKTNSHTFFSFKSLWGIQSRIRIQSCLEALDPDLYQYYHNLVVNWSSQNMGIKNIHHFCLHRIQIWNTVIIQLVICFLSETFSTKVFENGLRRPSPISEPTCFSRTQSCSSVIFSVSFHFMPQ